jgi:hypothetical protein
MSNPVLRSRRDLLAKTPLLAATHSSVGLRIHHISHFKCAAVRARFAPRTLASSQFMKKPASLAIRG